MTDQAELITRRNRELSEALAALYAAFAGYATPSKLDAPPLRDGEAILADLRSAPLHALSAAALGPYASFALTTVGDVAEYKHFLPRIVHLSVSVSHGQPGLDATLIASKLIYVRWHDWPDRERDAIIQVFEAAWARLHLMHPDKSDAGDWLCAMAMLNLENLPKLNLWLADTLPSSMVQFVQFVISTADLVDPSDFWEKVSPEIRAEIIDWLGREEVSLWLLEKEEEVPERDRWLFDRAWEVLDSRRGG
jgi:hypothetical protein